MERHDAATSPHFRIMIEIGAVMDYMTMLRGILADGSFVPGITSTQLARLPDFAGTQWELPSGISVESLLKRASAEKDFFERVRMYDFAHRDLTFLHRRHSEIVFYVPDHLEQFLSEIKDWTERHLPSGEGRRKVSIVAGDLENLKTEANIWVVRSPQIARDLKDRCQPFIVVDGKENATLRNVIRATRWDQIGFALRHAARIRADILSNVPNKRGLIIDEPIDDHCDIWSGYRFIPGDPSDAFNWVGLQQDDIRRLEHFPINSFTVEASGAPYTPEQCGMMFRSIQSDITELERRHDVLREIRAIRDNHASHHPRWYEIIDKRERKFRKELTKIEEEFDINPQNGYSRRRVGINIADSKNKKKKKQEPKDLGLSKSMTVQTLVHLMAKYPDLFDTSVMAQKPGELPGKIAERIATALLMEKKYEVISPTNEYVSSPNNGTYNGIYVQWTDEHGNSRNAEIDCLAYKDEKYTVVEVKLARTSSLTRNQRDLARHLDSGGKISSKQLPEIGEFSATFGTIIVDPNSIRRPAQRRPTNPIELSL